MRLVENDVFGSAIIIGAFSLVIILTEVWTRLHKPNPEITRKTIHICCGLGCLFFPFFVKSPVWVFVIACLFTAFFFLSEKTGTLKSLNSVNRKSRGSEYYPIAVFLVFYICQDKLWLYITSILILSVSDAAAAIIGSSYGKIHYKVGKEDVKSLEGSFFFWILTFMAIQIPLLLMTDLPRANCILCALLISFLLTGIEAVSIKGTDNIFVPLITCYGLLKITTKSTEEIAYQCISLFLIFLIIQFFVHKLKFMSIRESIVFIIFAYSTWSLGSIDWGIPIFTSFFLYCAIRRIIKYNNQYELDTNGLIRVIITPLIILLIANASNQYSFFYGAFLSATIVSCCCGLWIHTCFAIEMNSKKRLVYVSLTGLFASVAILVVTMMFQKNVPLHAFVWIPLISMIVMAGYDFIVGNKINLTGLHHATLTITPVSFLSSLLYLLIQYQGLIQTWNPKY
ncbi:MAG: hypothetical protein GY699_02575 [Desulfobacteraceae bacterium]|nr:hypothetical protein [Desulfobacteraceae bacterium]